MGDSRTGEMAMGRVTTGDGGSTLLWEGTVVEGESGSSTLDAKSESDFFPSEAGGGDGVVCKVEVDKTGLVVCDPLFEELLVSS